MTYIFLMAENVEHLEKLFIDYLFSCLLWKTVYSDDYTINEGGGISFVFWVLLICSFVLLYKMATGDMCLKSHSF